MNFGYKKELSLSYFDTPISRPTLLNTFFNTPFYYQWSVLNTFKLFDSFQMIIINCIPLYCHCTKQHCIIHILYSFTYEYFTKLLCAGSENSKPKLFVTLPSLKGGSPVTLATVSDQTYNNTTLLEPYPDWSWHQGDCDGITSVFRTAVCVSLINC